jgi:16S rRNA processing protein RimM
VTRPDPELLAGREELVVEGRRVAIERRAGRADKPILRLAGCDSREAVEALRGAALLVPLEEAPPLQEGEFWAHELEGCTVVDGERVVGVVARMVSLPSCEALEVGDLLIPLVGDAVRSIDVAARRIDVDMGFLGEAA